MKAFDVQLYVTQGAREKKKQVRCIDAIVNLITASATEPGVITRASITVSDVLTELEP